MIGNNTKPISRSLILDQFAINMVFVDSVDFNTWCRQSSDLLKTLFRRESFGLFIVTEHFAPGFFKKRRPQLFFFYNAVFKVVICCGGNDIINNDVMLLTITKDSKAIKLLIEIHGIVEQNSTPEELLILWQEKHYGGQVSQLNILLFHDGKARLVLICVKFHGFFLVIVKVG